MTRALALFAPFFLGACSLRDTAPPRAQTASSHRVVFVHGIFDSGETSFGTMRRRLESKGFVCINPSLKPADGSPGLDVLAAELKRDIDAQFGPKEKFSIVAFSMGGLVSRYYLQELGGASRCENLVTISSPHHGTPLAWMYPGKGAKQMRNGSDFIAKLEDGEKKLGKIPVASYRTPFDLVVPPSSSVWKRAENAEFNVSLHPLMPFDPKVVDAVEARLTGSR